MFASLIYYNVVTGSIFNKWTFQLNYHRAAYISTV